MAKKAFRVTARLYSEVAEYYEWDKSHEFPHYSEVAGTERNFDLEKAILKNGTKVDSLETAEMWVLENHPDYLQGCCIVEKVDKNADFLMTPVPCGQYLDGYFENYENRRLYAKWRAEQMGVMIGKETAKDVLELEKQANEYEEWLESIQMDVLSDMMYHVETAEEREYEEMRNSRLRDNERI